MVPGKKVSGVQEISLQLCSSLFLAYLASVLAAQLNPVLIRLAGLTG